MKPTPEMIKAANEAYWNYGSTDHEASFEVALTAALALIPPSPADAILMKKLIEDNDLYHEVNSQLQDKLIKAAAIIEREYREARTALEHLLKGAIPRSRTTDR